MKSVINSIFEDDETFTYNINSSTTNSTLLNNTTVNLGTIYSSDSTTGWEFHKINSTPSVKITDADIFINGKGLGERLEHIEKRLDILVVNPVLEQKYEVLKKLGDEYRKLEKELLEKDKIIDILKK